MKPTFKVPAGLAAIGGADVAVAITAIGDGTGVEAGVGLDTGVVAVGILVGIGVAVAGLPHARMIIINGAVRKTGIFLRIRLVLVHKILLLAKWIMGCGDVDSCADRKPWPIINFLA